MQARCEGQNLGFEPLTSESTGGYAAETARLFETLCKVVDLKEKRPAEHT